MKTTGRSVVVIAAVLALAVLVPALAAGDDDTVVVSRPGVVYHKAGSLDVRGRGHERPLSEALAAGYSPCPICFAKAAGTTTGGAALLAGSALSVVPRNGVVPPGLIHPSSLAQPFGLKIGTLYPPHGFRDGVRDPYVEPHTITRPASEQGAYGSGGAH